jgi:hypothetical protein
MSLACPTASLALPGISHERESRTLQNGTCLLTWLSPRPATPGHNSKQHMATSNNTIHMVVFNNQQTLQAFNTTDAQCT